MYCRRNVGSEAVHGSCMAHRGSASKSLVFGAVLTIGSGERPRGSAYTTPAKPLQAQRAHLTGHQGGFNKIDTHLIVFYTGAKIIATSMATPISRTAATHRKVVLTEAQAMAIYERKPATMETGMDVTATRQSKILAEYYGVSSKTVRDIWNRKTWALATRHSHDAGTGQSNILNSRSEMGFVKVS